MTPELTEVCLCKLLNPFPEVNKSVFQGVKGHSRAVVVKPTQSKAFLYSNQRLAQIKVSKSEKRAQKKVLMCPRASAVPCCHGDWRGAAVRWGRGCFQCSARCRRCGCCPRCRCSRRCFCLQLQTKNTTMNKPASHHQRTSGWRKLGEMGGGGRDAWEHSCRHESDREAARATST